jgi:hypothetical protein
MVKNNDRWRKTKTAKELHPKVVEINLLSHTLLFNSLSALTSILGKSSAKHEFFKNITKNF